MMRTEFSNGYIHCLTDECYRGSMHLITLNRFDVACAQTLTHMSAKLKLKPKPFQMCELWLRCVRFGD